MISKQTLTKLKEFLFDLAKCHEPLFGRCYHLDIYRIAVSYPLLIVLTSLFFSTAPLIAAMELTTETYAFRLMFVSVFFIIVNNLINHFRNYGIGYTGAACLMIFGSISHLGMFMHLGSILYGFGIIVEFINLIKGEIDD